MSDTDAQPSRAFLRLAALGAFLYVAAQVFQWIVISFAPPAPSPEAAILNRLMPLAQARAFLVMASFPCVLLAYAGVALCVFRRSPGAAITGLVFASLFVALELAYRSVDFFVVTQNWALQLQDLGDSSLTNFRVYFPLTVAVYGFMGFWLWLRTGHVDQEAPQA